MENLEITNHILKIVFSEAEQLEVERQFDEKQFERILIKTRFEKYTDDLFQWGVDCKLYQGLNIQNKERFKKHIDYGIELTEGIIFLMENDKINLKLSSPTKSITLTNKEITDYLLFVLTNEFKNTCELDKIQMRYDTGKELLESGQYNDWLDNYYRELSKEMGLMNEFGEVGWSYYSIDDEVINDFIFAREEKAEIDLMFLKWRLLELKKYKKRGAPKKNEHIEYYLKEFLKFCPKLTNADYKIIFDCCVFFTFIQDEIKSGGQYIKAIHTQIKSKRKQI